MMDTILNLGLNDVAVEGLARTTGNARFARDSYRRLVQMYGEVVDGVDGHRFEQALGDLKRERGVQQDVDLTADDLAELVETFKAIYRQETADEFPQDAREQLRRAVLAVFQSWQNPRAQVYRRTYGIADDIGTAVNVVQMVFGNKGDRSATGVCFTRDPSTGEPSLYGEYLVNAQGEDVVAGIRTPQPIEEMRERLPEAYDQLMDTMSRLEQHYRDMQDIEFTIEDGKLYILQTRSAKRTAAAALKAAADMTNEGLISREEAIARIDPVQLDQLLHPMLDPAADVRRRRARAQCVAGRGVRCDRARRRHRGGARQGGRVGDPRRLGDEPGRHPRDDLVEGRAHRARRHDVARGRRRARDGQAVRRGLRRADASTPTRRRSRIGSHELHEGDTITIDGGSGSVIVGEVALVPPQINEDFETVLGWADDVRRLKVRANADNAEDSAKAREFGAQGIGLCRTEHMFFGEERLPVDAGDDPRRATRRAAARRSTGCCRSSSRTSRRSSR